MSVSGILNAFWKSGGKKYKTQSDINRSVLPRYDRMLIVEFFMFYYFFFGKGGE